MGGTGEGREDDAPGALGSSPARRSRGSTGGCLTPSAQVRQDPRHPRGGGGKGGEREKGKRGLRDSLALNKTPLKGKAERGGCRACAMLGALLRVSLAPEFPHR